MTESQKNTKTGRAKGRRMIASEITEADRFFEMSAPAQAAYFHFLARSDDQGFCDQVKAVLFYLAAGKEVLDELEAAGYIYVFPGYVLVIRDFHFMNYVDERRSTGTKHINELKQLTTDNLRYYRAQGCTQGKADMRADTRADMHAATQAKGKESKVKESKVKENISILNNINSAEEEKRRDPLTLKLNHIQENLIPEKREQEREQVQNETDTL